MAASCRRIARRGGKFTAAFPLVRPAGPPRPAWCPSCGSPARARQAHPLKREIADTKLRLGGGNRGKKVGDLLCYSSPLCCTVPRSAVLLSVVYTGAAGWAWSNKVSVSGSTCPVAKGTGWHACWQALSHTHSVYGAHQRHMH